MRSNPHLSRNDGAVQLPSPVLVGWTDASKHELRLRVRPYSEYPRYKSWAPLSQTPRRQEPTVARDVPAAFVVRVDDNGGVRGTLVRHLSPKVPGGVLVSPNALELEGEALLAAFRAELVVQGLTGLEAVSIERIWHREFFRTSGLRVVSVLPRWLYDLGLPIEFVPRPEKLVRVGLIWRECEKLAIEDAASFVDRVSAPQTVELTTARKPQSVVPLELGPAQPLEDAPGGVVARLPTSPGGVAVSRDGRYAAITYTTRGEGEVHVVDFERRTRKRVAAPHASGGLAMSSDGTKVSYLTSADGFWRAEIADLQTATRTLVRGSTGTNVANCDLSADGGTLAYVNETALHIVDLSQKTEQSVEVRTPPRRSFPLGRRPQTGFRCGRSPGSQPPRRLRSRSRRRERHPAFAVAGRRPGIVHFRQRTLGGVHVPPQPRLGYLRDRSGDGSRRVRDPRTERNPSLDASGERLLYRRHREFAVLDRASGTITALPGIAGYGEISGDGRRIVSIEWLGGKVCQLREFTLETIAPEERKRR